MDIQYFITFREVARCQNLTRAAEKLGYAQPTVSVQIQRLENHFGVKLFERSSKRLKLTASGVQMLAYADQIAQGYHQAKETFSTGSNVSLAIGTTETLAAFFLPPYFQAFRNRYPQANVVFFPTSDHEIIRKIKSNELDIGFVLDMPVTDPELSSISVRNEELIFICSKDHPLHGRSDMSIRELENSPFILTERGCCYRSALERSMNDKGISYQVVSEMGSLEGIKQCVLYGMGIAMIPKIAANDMLIKEQLSAFSVREDTLASFYTQIIIHKNKHISAPLRYLIDLIGGSSSLDTGS
ncbi:LysR family transcriptional regulator [Paenibacillus filicis]|uniref:LysR family transcriptional regulator n=1 Tax=Paenibacillus filicis TaxID=669464 RepID=UPI00311A5489